MQTSQPQPAAQVRRSEHDRMSGRFGRRNALEIGVALKNLMNRGDWVAVQYQGGQFTTRIAHVDVTSRQFVFEQGTTAGQDAALLASDRNLFIAQLDGVRLEFWSGLPHTVEYAGYPALVGMFPETLYFMQRREYFRVDTPVLDPFICYGKLADGAGFRYEVHDISLGGIGVRTPDERAATLALESVLLGVKLDLGGAGMLFLDLQLVSRRRIKRVRGSTWYQLGFRFMTLPGHTENTLQRLITQLEMTRRSHSS